MTSSAAKKAWRTRRHGRTSSPKRTKRSKSKRTKAHRRKGSRSGARRAVRNRKRGGIRLSAADRAVNSRHILKGKARTMRLALNTRRRRQEPYVWTGG